MAPTSSPSNYPTQEPTIASPTLDPTPDPTFDPTIGTTPLNVSGPVVINQYMMTISERDFAETQANLEAKDVSMDEFATIVVAGAMHQVWKIAILEGNLYGKVTILSI